jgi:hypothetical protein
MKAGDHWIGVDGAQYLVVLPIDVGERRRWWIDRGLVDEFDRAAVYGFKTRGGTLWQVGPSNPDELHQVPYCEDCADDHEIVFALVLPC